MPAVTPATVRRHITTRQLAPVYLVCGVDETERVNLAGAFAEAVDEELRAFNVDRLYGSEVTIPVVLDAIRTLPLMAPRRVVVLHQAERVLAPKRESQQIDRDLELLERYLEKPFTHATLVFVTAGLDERRRISRVLRKHAVVVECIGIGTDEDARSWVRRQAEQQGVAIDPKAADLLARQAGGDIGRLRADTERLFLYTYGSQTISVEQVREIMGPDVSLDDWAVTNAIEQRQPARALKELALLLEAGEEPLKVLGQLGWFVRTKMRSPRLREAVEAVLRTDLALKTSAGEPRVQFERLVVELCDCQSPSSRFG